MKQTINISGYLFGIGLIIFGLNKFLGFIPVEPPVDETAKMFLTTMFSSYLVTVVGAIEIIAGILFFFKRTVFLGIVILLPVMVNIVLFHLAHDLPGNGIWIVFTLLFCIISYPYLNKFKEILNLEGI